MQNLVSVHSLFFGDFFFSYNILLKKIQSGVKDLLSDKSLTLKQSQGHRTLNKNVECEKGYNHAMFEKSYFNSVQEKDKVVFFQMVKNVSIISFEHVWIMWKYSVLKVLMLWFS